MIENFNDRYQQMFLGKVVMATEGDLKDGSLAFEQRHNSKFRYSKLGGKTPLKALAAKMVSIIKGRKDYSNQPIPQRNLRWKAPIAPAVKNTY